MSLSSEKGLIYLRRRMVFAAAHRMHHPDVDDAVFGKCARTHGHNYTVEVFVKGVPDPKTGFVVDLKQLKDVMKERIHDILDHRNLDTDIPWFRNKVQSAENLAVFIWQQLEDHIPQGGTLHLVRLHETENNMVEYYG